MWHKALRGHHNLFSVEAAYRSCPSPAVGELPPLNPECPWHLSPGWDPLGEHRSCFRGPGRTVNVPFHFETGRSGCGVSSAEARWSWATPTANSADRDPATSSSTRPMPCTAPRITRAVSFGGTPSPPRAGQAGGSTHLRGSRPPTVPHAGWVPRVPGWAGCGPAPQRACLSLCSDANRWEWAHGVPAAHQAGRLAVGAVQCPLGLPWRPTRMHRRATAGPDVSERPVVNEAQILEKAGHESELRPRCSGGLCSKESRKWGPCWNWGPCTLWAGLFLRQWVQPPLRCSTSCSFSPAVWLWTRG